MRYPRAPITEALIDIRVELPGGTKVEDLSTVKPLVLEDYPREERRMLTEIRSTLLPEVKTAAEQRQLGYAFFSTDGKQVFQARLDGFTFSRLQPYDSWQALSSEARRLWDIYRQAMRPTKITRIAVRFINQLDLPGSEVEPEHYLNTFVQISRELPPDLRRVGPFIVSVRLQQTDLKGWMIINESLGPQKTPQTVPIILDFDLFVENPDVGDERGLWALFERLRDRKNVYFEASVTNSTRELLR